MKIKLFYQILVCLTFLITQLNADEILLGGFAKSNITPEQPVTLSGYENRKDLSTGIHDSLFVRVSAFKNNERRLVIVSTDIIGFYGGTDEKFRNAIIEKCNIEAEELFLSCIHTHAAPRIVLDKERGHANNVVYSLNLMEKIIQTINLALENLAPIKIGAGVGSSPVGANRREVYFDEFGNPRMWIGRNPDGVHDNSVNVVKISQNEKLACVMFEYAVHSTSLGWENYLISGDVHGLAEKFVENYLGQPVIAPAFAGASGDIDPWYRVLPGFESKNGWIPEPVLLGTLLGEEVVHVLNKIETEQETNRINSIYSVLQLPGKKEGEWEATKSSPNELLAVSVAKIGDIAFIGLGCEVLTEIGLAIKAASPFKHTMIITHCNGDVGYLAPQHCYNQRGYEVQSSPFASTAADMVVKSVLELLYQL